MSIRQIVNPHRESSIAVLLVSILLLPGCLSDEVSETSEIDDCTGESCESTNTNVDEEVVEEVVEEVISISGIGHCDNTNPDHCLLPFPSSAFLTSDSQSLTGFRVNIPGKAIPDSSSAISNEFHMINSRDGHSPATQIFTTFSSLPDISALASQDNITPSVESGHGLSLIHI